MYARNRDLGVVPLNIENHPRSRFVCHYTFVACPASVNLEMLVLYWSISSKQKNRFTRNKLSHPQDPCTACPLTHTAVLV